MSAWDVYWIMQADSISLAIGAPAILIGLAAIGCSIGWLISHCEGLKGEEAFGRATKRLGCAAMILWVVSFAIPSTKTLAAMYVVPAIINNEELKTDLGEVYELGMERLKEVLEVEPTEE